MKITVLLAALIGLSALVGCSTNRGGTADDYDTSYGNRSSNWTDQDWNMHEPSVPIRPFSQPIPPP